MVKPYTDDYLNENQFIRIFDPERSSDDFVWHRDHNDREIEILEGDGWQFQFDDELPSVINKNDKIKIPKMVYHRIIPGKNKLRILINENL